MLKLLADEHIPMRFVKALRQREPSIDIVRLHDVGLRTRPDPEILAWAALNSRVLVTFDRETLPGFAYHRLTAGEDMAGLVVIDQTIPMAQAVEELVMVADGMDETEIQVKPVFIPLRPS